MTIEEMTDENGELKPEIVERAKTLTRIIAELCKDEEPAITLFVLEAAMTAHIGLFAPPLADLFRSMMKAYKDKAAVLITLVDVLKNGGNNLEELLRMADEANPTSR